MSDENPLTRRRLLTGIGTIGLAASGVGAGAGTYTFFTDAEQSTDNSIQAGTLDLSVEESETVTGTLTDTVSGVAPGKAAWEIAVDLSNTGSLEADHLDIDFRNTADEDDDGDPDSGLDSGPESDSDPDSASGMDKEIRVERLAYTDTSGVTTEYVTGGATVDLTGTNPFRDANENGYVDLGDFEALSAADEEALDGFDAPTTDGAKTTFELELSSVLAAANRYQGDVVETDIEFTLQQDSSQDATGTQTR